MTRKIDPEMTAEAINGWFANDSGAYFSSERWMVNKAGYELGVQGFGKPTAAWMSKGYSVRLQTAANEFIVKFEGKELDRVSIERLG